MYIIIEDKKGAYKTMRQQASKRQTRDRQQARQLDRAFKLYAYLLRARAGAYYYHYETDFNILKRELKS